MKAAIEAVRSTLSTGDYPEEVLQRLVNSVSYCHQPRFKERLAELIEVLPVELGHALNLSWSDWVKRAWVERNNLAHAKKAPPETPNEWQELTVLAAQAEVLLHLTLLRGIGLSPDELVGAGARTRMWRTAGGKVGKHWWVRTRNQGPSCLDGLDITLERTIELMKHLGYTQDGRRKAGHLDLPRLKVNGKTIRVTRGPQ